MSTAQGCVVNVTSIAGSRVHPFAGSAYATSKAALAALTREMSHDFGPRGIRVNAILPGFLETALTRQVTAKRRAEILAAHSLGAFNTPAAVAGFIHHLHHCLPHTSGQFFQLDSRLGR